MELFIETDIILDFLNNNNNRPSALELAMSGYNCFTSMYNASELYFGCVNENETEFVTSVLRAVKVIGFNSRYSMLIPRFREAESVRDAMICTVCYHNKLPILTSNVEKYKFSGIKIFHPDDIRG